MLRIGAWEARTPPGKSSSQLMKQSEAMSLHKTGQSLLLSRTTSKLSNQSWVV